MESLSGIKWNGCPGWTGILIFEGGGFAWGLEGWVISSEVKKKGCG
jgi:hypothetical protein